MKVNKYRTNTCGELTISDLGKNVVLSGFVQTIRDHGGVMFLDLRDHAGITQVVVHDESMLEGVSKETVIKVTGEVIRRDEETVNTKLLTGEIEIKCESLEVLSPNMLSKDSIRNAVVSNSILFSLLGKGSRRLRIP